MANPLRSYRLHLFTIHLWQETISQDQIEWRGRVTDTRTGAIGYFRQWQELEGLLLGLLEDSPRPGASDDITPPDASSNGL